jgi:murein DD-endopeptidase MepM/ murein hydrolase activator NlpD
MKTGAKIAIATAVGIGIYLLSRKKAAAGNSLIVYGKVSSPYSAPPGKPRIDPVTGKKEYHNGIDLPAPIGTPLIAPLDGIVVKSSKDDLNGFYTLVRLSDGYTLGFAHLKQMALPTGRKFKKGTTFARTGSTGKSTGPHTHFTVRDKSGKNIDPDPYRKKFR